MQTEHINRTNIQFDKGDLVEYSVNGGNYSAFIDLKMADGKVLQLQFNDNADLKAFIEHLMYAASKMEWDQKYPSNWHRATEEVTSIEAWKAGLPVEGDGQKTPDTPW